jgi:hypothetical protein
VTHRPIHGIPSETIPKTRIRACLEEGYRELHMTVIKSKVERGLGESILHIDKNTENGELVEKPERAAGRDDMERRPIQMI